MTEEERLFRTAIRHHRWRTPRNRPGGNRRPAKCTPRRMRELRYQAGLYQRQAAQALGVSEWTYTRWENAVGRIPFTAPQLRARFGLDQEPQ